MKDLVLRDVSVVVQIVHMEAEDDPVAEVTPQEHVKTHNPRLESDGPLDLAEVPTTEQTLHQSVLRDHVERIVQEFPKNSPVDTLRNDSGMFKVFSSDFSSISGKTKNSHVRSQIA